MRKSMTVADRTCCCHVSMKYTRNGTNDSARAACDREPKSRRTMSVKREGAAEGGVFPGSVSPSKTAAVLFSKDSARSLKGAIAVRISCEARGRLATKETV